MDQYIKIIMEFKYGGRICYIECPTSGTEHTFIYDHQRITFAHHHEDGPFVMLRNALNAYLMEA